MALDIGIDEGMDWSTAVPDWESRIKAGKSLLPELPLHDKYAEKALNVFKNLRAPDIDGFPLYGDICEPWVFDLVRVIFGSYDPELKRRYLREFFVMIPKKNGKTAIAAAIIVTACILNEMPEAQFILIAPSIELARNAYDQAAGIIKRTPMITPIFAPPQETNRTIKNLNTAIPSKIMIKAADADIVTGLKNATVLIDETHVFANRPAAKGVFTEVRGAMSHPQNKHFLLQITTQSKVTPTGVFKTELSTARKVRDGKLKRPMVALLYELPFDLVTENKWKNEDTWGLVNPHLGRSVDLNFLRDELSKAEDEGAESLALLASQHFNVEIGTAQGDDGWRAQTYWDSAADTSLSLDALLKRSEVCVVGIDGGGDDDLCGLVVMGREKGSRRLLVWCHAWCQKEVLQLRPSIAPSLETFARDGDLTICKEPFQHVFEAVDIVRRVSENGLLPDEAGVGVDVAGLPELVDELENAGFGAPLATSVPQGWKLQSAIKSIPLRLKAKSLRHGGQPIFAWSIGNSKVEVTRSNQYITKALAGAAKIDVTIGLLNAAILMFLNPEASGRGLDEFLANPVMVT